MDENIKYPMYGKEYYKRPQYSADMIHQEAMKWLDKQDGKQPFFGIFTYTLPHAELVQPEDSILEGYQKKFFHDKTWGGSEGSRYNASVHTHAQFAGMITRLDHYVGEVLKKLKEKGMDENTLVIFTSDNGPVIDDGYQDHAYELLNGHTPMGIYRGGKYSAYEAGTRVPFIVRWPVRVKPNKQQALFSQIDVYASLASLLDQPLRKGAAPDSQEHLNVLLGKNNTNREYVVQQNLNNTLAIIKGQWKYIEPSDGPAIEYWTKMELGNDKQPQLYDLSSDPSEKTNVSKQYPDIVKELSELLESVKRKNSFMRTEKIV